MPDAQERAILDKLFEGVYCLDREHKITYWNPACRRLTGYAAFEVIGADCRDNLRHVDEHGENMCTNKCPVQTVLQTGREQQVSSFLQHREGHRIRVRSHLVPRRDKDANIVGILESFVEDTPRRRLSDRVAELEGMAYVDVLTRIGNERYLELQLHQRAEELKRYQRPFGLILSDIDNLHRINDRHGHETGNRIVRMIARTAVEAVRPFDIVARRRADEFAAVAVNASEETLGQIAERLRALLREVSVPCRTRPVTTTVSVGAAMANPDERSGALLARAQDGVRRSQAAGGDTVTLARGA